MWQKDAITRTPVKHHVTQEKNYDRAVLSCVDNIVLATRNTCAADGIASA